MPQAVRELHYFTVGSAEDGKFFEDSIGQLNDWLQLEFDSCFELSTVSSDDQSRILDVLRNSDASDWSSPLKKFYLSKSDKTVNPVLAVYCPCDEEIGTNAQQTNPAAIWGVSDQTTFAVTYEPDNRQLLWHELLHTIGADDCYAFGPDGASHIAECDCPQCLMWYIPNETNCGTLPQLCTPNSKLISNYVTQAKQRK